MDVDVEVLRVDLDEQGGQRMAVARQEVGIGGPQRPGQQLVAHRPVIDEQVLVHGIATRKGRQAGITAQAHAFAPLVDQQGIVGEITAQDGAQAFQPALEARRLAIELQRALAVQLQRKADIFVRHGLALDLFGNGQVFRALGLHELQPRRRGIEQVAQLDQRAVFRGKSRRLQRTDGTAVDLNAQGRPALARTRRDR